MGEFQIGLQAMLMSQALRKLSGIVSKTKTVVIFLNQTRMKIGIMFGNPETTPGGLALKFYASIRIDLRRIAGSWLQFEDIKLGQGTEGGKDFLKGNPEIAKKIKDALLGSSGKES